MSRPAWSMRPNASSNVASCESARASLIIASARAIAMAVPEATSLAASDGIPGISGSVSTRAPPGLVSCDALRKPRHVTAELRRPTPFDLDPGAPLDDQHVSFGQV